ncbi:MAG: type VI secretion system contractile sheath large subunit [Thermoanaerobaculaceae bacterium]|nr:type VI secretion system contractile sheath large subunit [Thermoanaerobaculaceae bacterium]
MSSATDPPAAITTSPGSRPAPTLRVLVLADLAAGRVEPTCRVTLGDLTDLLARLAPALSLRVPNRLGVGPQELACALSFRALEDFHLDHLARAHPLLQAVARVRGILAAARDGKLAAADLRQQVLAATGDTDLGITLREKLGTHPATEAARSGGSPVDSLLGMVEVAPPAPSASAGLLDALVATLSLSPGAVGGPVVEGAVRTFESRLTLQLAALADAAPLRDLDAAWRGLELLLRRVSPSSPATVEVQPTSKADLLDTFYDTHFEREHAGEVDPPLGLVVAAFAFDRSPRDIEDLQHAARMAASLGVPVLLEVAPEFFGVKQAGLVVTMPDLIGKCRGPEYAKWNRLRADDASLWLGLAFNRLLLRPAWGEAGAEVATFGWDAAAAGAANRPLWGSGAWALGAAVLQGYAAEGLRFPVAGAEGPAVLTGLPTRVTRVGKGDPVALAVEATLSDQKALELIESGFSPLVGQPGLGQAYFLSAPSARSVTRYESEEATAASFRSATLPYQLFASMAARALASAAHQCGSGLGEDGVRSRIQAAMLDFLASAEPTTVPEEVDVEVIGSPDSTHLLDVAVRLRPVFPIYGGPADLVLGTQALR